VAGRAHVAAGRVLQDVRAPQMLVAALADRIVAEAHPVGSARHDVSWRATETFVNPAEFDGRSRRWLD
jgi:hypothetical protein